MNYSIMNDILSVAFVISIILFVIALGMLAVTLFQSHTLKCAIKQYDRENAVNNFKP